MESKLMPCPFCGGEAEKENDKDEQGTEYVYVGCQTCYARSDGWYLFEGKENAEKVVSELWNRRSADDHKAD